MHAGFGSQMLYFQQLKKKQKIPLKIQIRPKNATCLSSCRTKLAEQATGTPAALYMPILQGHDAGRSVSGYNSTGRFRGPLATIPLFFSAAVICDGS